jgi:hypothetical protein
MQDNRQVGSEFLLMAKLTAFPGLSVNTNQPNSITILVDYSTVVRSHRNVFDFYKCIT